MKQINVTNSSMPDFAEYCKEIQPLWETKWLTNSGVKHRELETRLREYTNSKGVALFTNGHLALEALIVAMGLTGEIITTPFTFASTTHAIVRAGVTPVFCDIDANTFTIDVTKIESLITPKTSAILPVHVYGNICDYKAIDLIAKKHNLKVIYDAAHAFGTTINGVNAMKLGDASMCSFHATKVFNTIEGGAIFTDNQEIVQVLNVMKNFGLIENNAEYVGGNGKMNEFQAAMGLCNLRHLEREIAKRKVCFEMYTSLLSGIKGIKLLTVPKNVESNFSYYPIVLHDTEFDRDSLFARLKENGVNARKYFYPTTNRFNCYKKYPNITQGNTPIAEQISENILCLPLYADLNLDDIKFICSLIRG